MDKIVKERPEQQQHLKLEENAYVAFHQNSVHAICKKAFLADALLNELFIIACMKVCLQDLTIDWGPINY